MIRSLLFIIVCSGLFAQGAYSQNLDSLRAILEKQELSLNDQLVILKLLADGSQEIGDKLSYSQQLIDLATSVDSGGYIVSGFLQKGTAQRLSGDMSDAVGSFFKAAEVSGVYGLQRDVGLSHIAAADVYSNMDNHEDAIHYYRRGINILRLEDDTIGLASALLNTGDEFWNHDELDSALVYFKESGELFELANYEVGKAYNLGNIGLVYAKKDLGEIAENNINEAIDILEKYEDYYPICVYLAYMSDIYRDKGDINLALEFAKDSYYLANKYSLKQEISDASFRIYELYESTDNAEEALTYYKQFVAFRDSVNNLSSVQETSRLRADYEIAQSQLKLNLLKEQKQNQRISMIASIIAAISVTLLAIGLYMRYRYIYRTNKIIESEKNRAEDLLHNILPEEIGEELKEHGKVKAKRFDSVTVMFTDFISFSRYSEHIEPEKLVQSVDYYFSKFDEIMDKHGLEKIKTVGDAYLCAGGLPYPSENHAVNMIHASKDILRVIEDSKNIKSDIISFDIRIGIHTGAVVAGVVGSKKFAYDIWGDTVNVASRMETNAEKNHINISQSTYELIKDVYNCEHRGEIDIKNRSNIGMYYVRELI